MSLFCFGSSAAQQIKGVVVDEQGEPLPFASIYVQHTSLGISTDAKGRYQFDLEAGEYVVVFSYIGYSSIEKAFSLKAGEIVVFDAILGVNSTELGEVQVIADSKGAAKAIIGKAQKLRKHYLQQLSSYQCETYVKMTLDRKLIKPTVKDTLLLEVDTVISKKKQRKIKIKNKRIQKNRDAFFDKNNLQLIEKVSDLYFKYPSTFKEHIKANNDYSNRYKAKVSVSFTSGGGDIVPIIGDNKDPHLVYSITDPNFNFYQNTIDFPSVCSKPILSPLAFSAQMNYTYDYEGVFEEDGHKVFKIKVIPRFKSSTLFSGYLFIEDSTYAIKSVDLEINPKAMFGADAFKIIQNYAFIAGKSLPVRREIIYTIKEGNNHFIGNVSVRHKGYKLNPVLPKHFFNRQVKTYETDAFEKDSTFWVSVRPVTFKPEELKFISQSDSIKQHHESPAYKAKQDSIYNHIGIWDVVLFGFGHRDHTKGYSFDVLPLIAQVVPFGIGGYRHRLGGSITKEFLNTQRLEVEGFIDYGFKNEDFKGRVGVGYTYLPKKFMRSFVRFGDFYEQINNYESLSASFSRSNYVRTKSYSIEQRMEIVNGLFGVLTLKYAHQIPIAGLQLSNWSKELFGDTNAPKEFAPYKKSEIKLKLQYRPYQKFYFYGNKKVIIGSNWPEFTFEYRKGLKGILNSEVDYDYLEMGVSDYRNIGRLGYSNWAVQTGSFINHRNLRFLEHKFFRGSDKYFFSNPINSFQLLGPTLNTRNEYFSANYIHHFDGAILNKIPLLNWLKLELAAGGGTLLIRDINFAHIELFAGIERKVKIFKQPFKLGLYGVTSDNSLAPTSFQLKFGASLFDAYKKKWAHF